MKHKYLFKIFFLFLTFFTFQLSGQVINDNFEDGDLTGWTEGTASDWINSTSSPLTGTRSLKHNLSGVSSSSYIYHSISSLDLTTQDITWSFNLANGNWDPSSSNKFLVFLTANETNLNSGTVDGYAVGVNLTGSTDLLTLWKVTDGSADGAIVTSSFDWNSNSTAGIRVTRTSAGAWELLVDTDGGFDSLISAGTGSNSDYTHDDNFGLSFTFSTTRAGLLSMDDVLVEGTSASPNIAFESATSTENETNATFTSTNIPITVSNYDGNQIDINVNVTGGTAEIGDYTFTSPTALSFTSNSTQNISLDINPDTDDFDDETIILTLTETSTVTGLVISQATHTLTITDDETAPSIGFGTTTSTETETDATFTSANIPITVSNYSGTQIDINVNATLGTAEAGDFTFTSPTALSFTSNGTQNITFSINDDADTDAETIIFSITETSAVSGLIISEVIHVVTILDDEIPPVPEAGKVFITEVLDSSVGFNNDYLELFNNSSENVSLSTSKLIRMSSSGTVEYIYDFGVDESSTSLDLTIPAYGFIIISRGSNRADYNTAFGITLAASVNFNSGNSNLFFGSGRRWNLKTGGTVNTDDGTLIDDTLTGVGSSKDYRDIFTNTFISGATSEGTPGALEYLVYNGGTWVNSVALDATTATKNAYIYDDLTLSTNTEANDIGIIAAKGINITAGNSLTINGNLTFNGTDSYLQANATIPSVGVISSASLILKGTLTEGGSNHFTYFTETFNDNTSGWSLISSPTVGESIEEFTTFNELQESTLNPNNFGIAPYNNDGTMWNYYTGATDGTTYATGANPLNASGNFTSGVGYSVLPNSVLNADTAKGNLGFKGAIPTTDFTGGTAIPISDNSGASGNAFNLIGNPYPSFIFVGSDPAATNEFLDTNKNELAESTLWFWDKAASAYVTVNNTSNRYIAPAQGFFIKSKTGGGNISFTEAMQSHQASGIFNKTENIRPEIQITVLNNNDSKSTSIYYYDNKTTGFDNGFDSSIFDGVDSDFSVYTKLVSAETNHKLAIQTLPTENYDTMVIPVEVNGAVNSEIVFSINSLNLPKGYNVYLEDKLNNSFINLDTETYKTAIDESLKENRFFVHTKTSNILSTNNENLETVSIFTTNNNNLRIIGLQKGKTTVSLVNILGKNIITKNFDASRVQDISLPKLASGVYIVNLQNNDGRLTKKIILE